MARVTGHLVAELVAARDEFFAALHEVDTERLTRGGLVGEWSGQELIAHVGYWAGNAVDVIQAAERGAAESFGEGRPSVDEINHTVAKVARRSDLASVQVRERASFETLVERLGALEPALLEVRLSDGVTVEQGIREDAAEHYREHAAELRAALRP